MTKEQEQALTNWMGEVTQLLCYQPDIPLKHKTDVCDALNNFMTITEALRIVIEREKK